MEKQLIQALAFPNALQRPWTDTYAKFLALILLYGATAHVSNIFGLTGTP
ncbi:MAG: hypothetical protein ACFCBU_00565 [Cyanophyceae cyanobacterium]